MKGRIGEATASNTGHAMLEIVGPASAPVSRVSQARSRATHDDEPASATTEAASESCIRWGHRASEQRLPSDDRSSLDALAALVLVIDPEGRIIEWNRACSELLGYELAEVRGRAVWECLVPASNGEAARQAFLRALEAERCCSCEQHCSTKRGDLKWICWSIRVVRLPDGRVEQLIASGIDRTEARREETRLMCVAAVALVTADETQRIVGFDGDAERLFGWDARAALGEPLERLIAPASRPAYHRVVRWLRDDPRRGQKLGQRGFDFAAQRSGGEPFEAEAAVVVRAGGDGHEFTLVIRDISYRKQLEMSLRREIRVRDELTRTVLHDLRNSLNAVALQAQLMVRPSDQGERRSTVAPERIKRSVHHMSRLLDHLAGVSRIQAGRVPLDKAPVDLARTLREAVDSALPQACVKRIRLQLEAEPKLPIVHADPTSLMQVLNNLLGNALKFCPEEGTVRVDACCAAEQLVVRVTNSGPAIPAEQRMYLFEPFWQGDPHRGSGAGLGLAIAKGIIEAHQGRIWVESSSEMGTSFVFALPV